MTKTRWVPQPKVWNRKLYRVRPVCDHCGKVATWGWKAKGSPQIELFACDKHK